MLNTDREEESVRHNLHPLPPLFSQNNVRQRAHGKANLRSVAKSYRRAHPFDLAAHPFDLLQILFYSETKDFR